MAFTADQWRDLTIKKFLDDNNTIFERGPFEIDGKTYDWKLTDPMGEDYCNISELVDWNIKIKTIIE